MNRSAQYVTRTAILLALTVVAQSLRSFIPIPQPMDQFIIGSLVNLCLVVAAVMVGIEGGLAVAILAPVIAFLQQQMKFPVMIPFVAIGNAVIVIVFALLYQRNKYGAIVLGALLKSITLYVGVALIAIPLFLSTLPAPVKAVLSFKFGWPQFITATIGGLIAIGLLPLLRRALPSMPSVTKD